MNEEAKATKKCSICGKTLPLSAFYSNSSSKDGHHSCCKECYKQRNKKFYEAAKEKLRTSRLADFTPRELMEELRRRGYEGKLYYTEVHTIELSKI